MDMDANRHLEFSPFISSEKEWILHLYVEGNTRQSILVLGNVYEACRKLLGDRYELQVIDVCTIPYYQYVNQIIILPTLIRLLPTPVLKIQGGLDDLESIIYELGLDDLRN